MFVKKYNKRVAVFIELGTRCVNVSAVKSPIGSDNLHAEFDSFNFADDYFSSKAVINAGFLMDQGESSEERS